MRTESHVTDTKAVKRVMLVLPDHWVVRELTERDYGIDLLAEIFMPGLTDGKGADAYDSSGAIFHIQIKGTSKILKRTKLDTINFSMSRDSLLYIEKFSVPFFLFRLSTHEGAKKVYFVWLQRYIRDQLDDDCPDWRERSEKTVPIKIPRSNQVKKNIDRISEIAYRPKLFEELLEYREYYDTWFKVILAASSGDIDRSQSLVRDLIKATQKLLRLRVLLKHNECCIDEECVYDLIDYLDGMLEAGDTFTANKVPHEGNFELLSGVVSMFSGTENFILQNFKKTAY
jgi:hypothetical protein